MFDTSVGKIGLIICYDRHFPEIGRAARPEGGGDRVQPLRHRGVLSKYLWELEQPAHAVANGYWIAAINRVGTEEPLIEREVLRFLVLLRPPRPDRGAGIRLRGRGARARRRLDMIREVRNTWQFLRDRRPELYGELTQLLP